MVSSRETTNPQDYPDASTSTSPPRFPAYSHSPSSSPPRFSPNRPRDTNSRSSSPLRGSASGAPGPSPDSSHVPHPWTTSSPRGSPRSSPRPDYRAKSDARHAVNQWEDAEGASRGALASLGGGQGGGGDNSRSMGRGAGGLPPINTLHLHPTQQQQQQQQQYSQPPPSASSTSSNSPRLSFLQLQSSHPQQSSTSNSSTSSHHRKSPSPKDSSPTFPPSNSNSNHQSAAAAGPGSSSSHQFADAPGSYESHQPAGSSSSGAGRGSGFKSLSNPPSRQGSGSDRDNSSSLKERTLNQACAKCEQPMAGQFVRALGSVYHLDCFRCQDCNKVVASKFFPVDSADPGAKQYPLCETDYFRRLGLLCSKCGCALRGSYITALDMKFHVEHFTCSVCPTVFGPHDSYYEHAGSVYCHFHYSTRFAVKCTGCRTAILKQFVEINRNSTDEHWHPECYMIHKFWNIKLAPSPAVKSIEPSRETTPEPFSPVESAPDATGPPSKALEEDEYLAQEQTETPASLKDRQKLMEEQVYQIWTVLSAFEESSAACISEMLRHVSSGHYIEGVGMAEKFVLHVETLFSAIDDLTVQFKQAGSKEISHVREARMLCKKVVNFFSLLSHTHETGARKMSITQDLLSLVTGLAHYLKILIRIALTAALRLEREFDNKTAISQFLSRLDRLARDPEASKFSESSLTNGDAHKVRAYGYKSLTRAVGTLVGQGEATSDLCETCKLTVEDECARNGTSVRWHLHCLRCSHCGKTPPNKESQGATIPVQDFRIEPLASGSSQEGQGLDVLRGGLIYCRECAPASARDGFEDVTRLEQYAFLLCVALNKLYALLKERGVVPSSPTLESDEATGDSDTQEQSLYNAYRDSTDIKRMKSVNLDRKLSSTTARIPKRSTVIQSPTGRSVHPNDPQGGSSSSSKPPVPSRKDQPILDPSRATTVPRPVLPSQPTSFRSLPPESTNPVASRPNYNRATTQVQIVDDQAPDQSFYSEPLGGISEPTQDEDGITLADLPQVMEAEQAREQHRFLPPRQGTLLSELSALEYFIVKHVAALMLVSDNSSFKDVAPLEDLLEIIDARKNTFWGKLFKGGNDKKNVKKKGVFGIALDVLVERNGADSMHGAGPGSLRVPSFVDDVISAMKQMDMSIEGIFRKNGNIRRLKDLSEALDRDPSSANLSDENPVQLAALLKKFLRDLPDPLMTFKLFHLFIASQRVEDLEERKKTLHLVCCLLPKCHRDTLEAIFVFLKWVASFSHVDEETGSKMDLQNLATVICPNILYSKGKDPYKDESFSAVRVVQELLEYQDEFWQVPPEFAAILTDQELFANPSQLTSKEILARAEDYVKARPNRSMATPTRGEVQPQRPDIQQAWSSPTTPRGHNERPISFSTFGHGGYQGGPPQIRQPQPARPGIPPQPASYSRPSSQLPYPLDQSNRGSPDFYKRQQVAASSSQGR